jgi:hypothetical protein
MFVLLVQCVACVPLIFFGDRCEQFRRRRSGSDEDFIYIIGILISMELKKPTKASHLLISCYVSFLFGSLFHYILGSLYLVYVWSSTLCILTPKYDEPLVDTMHTDSQLC